MGRSKDQSLPASGPARGRAVLRAAFGLPQFSHRFTRRDNRILFAAGFRAALNTILTIRFTASDLALHADSPACSKTLRFTSCAIRSSWTCRGAVTRYRKPGKWPQRELWPERTRSVRPETRGMCSKSFSAAIPPLGSKYFAPKGQKYFVFRHHNWRNFTGKWWFYIKCWQHLLITAYVVN